MWRAKAQVVGMPISAPNTMDHKDDRIGRPVQLPISEAKNTFVAIAPAAKG